MKTWTRQMGFPMVTVRRVQTRRGIDTYSLSQTRFLLNPDDQQEPSSSPYGQVTLTSCISHTHGTLRLNPRFHPTNMGLKQNFPAPAYSISYMAAATHQMAGGGQSRPSICHLSCTIRISLLLSHDKYQNWWRNSVGKCAFSQ